MNSVLYEFYKKLNIINEMPFQIRNDKTSYQTTFGLLLLHKNIYVWDLSGNYLRKFSIYLIISSSRPLTTLLSKNPIRS